MTTLTFFVGAIHEGFHERAYKGCVFLDIKGAFYHALHGTILSTIRQKGCPLDFIAIISSFLEIVLPVSSIHLLSFLFLFD